MANKGIVRGSVNVTIEYGQLDAITSASKKLVNKAAIKAFKKEAAVILMVAKSIVPHDTGKLERTGRVRIAKRSALMKPGVEIVFGGARAPYAVVQHENVYFNHSPGRTAKYLKRPFEAGVAAMTARLERELTAEIRKIGAAR